MVPAEWLELLHESYGELWSVVAETGLLYFQSTSSLVATVNPYVAEPEDLLSLVGVWYVDGTRRRELFPLQPAERSQWAHRTGSNSERYELFDGRIYLYPPPTAGQTYEVWYTPQSSNIAEFASDACIDVMCPEGEAFLIYDVATKAKSKREEDVRFAMAERERLRDRVRAWAINRMMTDPPRRIVGDMDQGRGFDLSDLRGW